MYLLIQWKSIRLVSVWISGLVHSEFYLLLALRCFGSFKPFQFSTEMLFKVQSFDMSFSLSVSFLCVYYSSIFGNVTRMKWHKSPKECDLLLTLPFALINPIIITNHGNRGTCFYRGCIPNTSRFRLSFLLTIRIKPLSLDNKHDHSACFLN